MVSTQSRLQFNPRSNLPDDFIFDAWYVAAWGEEVTRKPVRRIFLEEPVVLYRKQDGAPVESGPYIWIWMGDPAIADPKTIPDHHTTYDGEWSLIKDMRTIRARHALLIDNLMDLSHETFIHAGTIGSMDVAETPIRTDALTPETKHSTHDFWVIVRKTKTPRPAWVDQSAIAGQTSVLIEDLEGLEALEDNLPREGGWQELSINNDRGGLQWRRVFRERCSANPVRESVRVG